MKNDDDNVNKIIVRSM